jgi:hypothetical protein
MLRLRTAVPGTAPREEPRDTGHTLITIVILFVLVALALAFTLALGLGPFAIVPGVFLVALAIWLVAALARGQTPGRATRRTERPELLGPGGPDDPDA